MAITIITTAGAADANSYASEAELASWIELRLRNSAAVLAATADIKKKALILATRQIDELVEWDGEPTDPDVQALQWPRSGMHDDKGVEIEDDVIPDRLKNATCELACSLIDGDRTAEVATEGIDRIKAGPVEIEFSTSSPPARKVFTDTVFQMIALWGESAEINPGYIECGRG
jgi:hypothetical protein